MNAETTDLKKCHSEPFAFVIPNEVRNLLLLRAGSVRNLGFEILRFAQNDSLAVICVNPDKSCKSAF